LVYLEQPLYTFDFSRSAHVDTANEAIDALS
jgi:hypothetical protein